MDEESIIKSASTGDEAAFRMLVKTYQKYVFSICFATLKDIHEAENAAQETFLQVYFSLSQYEFRGFKSWIGKIALRKSIDCKRKLAGKQNFTISFLEDIEASPAIQEPSVQDKVIASEKRKLMFQIFSKLPHIYKTTIHKFYIQEKSYKEIALEENINLKTVESRLYRAKKILKEKWKEQKYDETL